MPKKRKTKTKKKILTNSSLDYIMEKVYLTQYLFIGGKF